VHFVNFVAFAGARLTKRTPEVHNVNTAAGERAMLTKCTRIVWVSQQSCGGARRLVRNPR